MQILAAKEEAQGGLKKDSKPLLLFVGELLKCDEILIAAEGEVLFKVCGGSLTAMKYYRCVLYP